MNSNRKSTMSREVFFILWVILTGAAMIIGFPISRSALINTDTPFMVYMWVFLGVIPLLAAFAQWPLLIYHHRSMFWWVPATFIGCLLNGLIGSFLLFPLALMQMCEFCSFSEVGMVFFIFLCLSPSGLSIGIAQWLVLRKDVHKAGLWILAATVAWALANGMIYLSLLMWLMEPNFLYWIIFYTFPGVITGLVMTHLIYGKRNNTSSDNELTAVR